MFLKFEKSQDEKILKKIKIQSFEKKNRRKILKNASCYAF